MRRDRAHAGNPFFNGNTALETLPFANGGKYFVTLPCIPATQVVNMKNPNSIHLMKTFAVICLLLTSLHARAGFVIVENVQIAGQKENMAITMTMKIKGDKARVDMGDQMSSITDTVTGDVLLLMGPQKHYMKTSMTTAWEMLKKITPAGEPKVVDTGKMEKVGNYNAEVYTAETPGMKLTVWATKDFPNYASIREQMKKMKGLQQMGEKAMGEAPDSAKIDGMFLKTVTETNGETITMTLVSAKEEPVYDADLQVPADYTEVPMPGAAAIPAQKPGESPVPAPQSWPQP